MCKNQFLHTNNKIILYNISFYNENYNIHKVLIQFSKNKFCLCLFHKTPIPSYFIYKLTYEIVIQVCVYIKILILKNIKLFLLIKYY